jgi:hypothetical protein
MRRSLLALVLPAAARAQGIGGVVRDTDGRPLFAAVVIVEPGNSAARTDAAGQFVLSRIKPGTYDVLVRRIGYREYRTEVTVVEDERSNLDVTLQAVAPTLDTVRAAVSHDHCDNLTLDGFLCRQQAGIGHFRDAIELAALKPEQLLDVVRGLPGIRPRPGRSPNGTMEEVPGVRPSRCLKTLVNGRPDIAPYRWWTARDVIAVEYYDQWNKIPLSYRQIADNVSCDLIIYWLTTARITQ